MSRTMYMIQNSKFFAFSHSREGAIIIKHLYPSMFKHARVKNVLQMYPGQIAAGAVYDRATRQIVQMRVA